MLFRRVEARYFEGIQFQLQRYQILRLGYVQDFAPCLVLRVLVFDWLFGGGRCLNVRDLLRIEEVIFLLGRLLVHLVCFTLRILILGFVRNEFQLARFTLIPLEIRSFLGISKGTFNRIPCKALLVEYAGGVIGIRDLPFGLGVVGGLAETVDLQ